MILPRERRQALFEKAKALNADLDLAVAYLDTRGITREAADMFLLGYVKDGPYAGRVSIPYLTPNGVVQIKYRATNQNPAKYLYESGCGSHLFNATALLHADRCVLTEGELDAITVQAYSGIAAIAYPGVSSWQGQEHYRMCFEGLSEVVVVADGDEVGRESARKVAESIGNQARVVDLGDGQDANQYISQYGISKFQEALSQ